MKYLLILFVLLLTASFASAETPKASDDTVTVRWKGVWKSGEQYCRSVGGGNYCIDAKEVVSVKKDGAYTIIVMKKATAKLKSYSGNAWSSSSSGTGYRTRKT